METQIVKTFANAIIEANKAAEQASTREDGGTCNMDTVVIDFTGWKQKDVDTVAGISGTSIGERMTGIWKGHRFVWTKADGMANNRTRMVEAAKKKLVELGIPATVWYQMD